MERVYSMVGNGNFCLQCLKQLLSQKRRISCIYSSDTQIAQIAHENAIPYFSQYKKYLDYLNDLSFASCVLLLNPVVYIPQVFYSMPFLRIHCQNSLLPNYPHMYAPSLVILNSEKKSGITWHTCEGDLYAGKIIFQKKYSVEKEDSALTLSMKGLEIALESFMEMIQYIELIKDYTMNCSGEPSFHKNDNAIPQHFLNHGIIDFDSTSEQILDLFRACNYGDYQNPFHVPKIVLGNSLFIVKEIKSCLAHSTVGSGRLLEIIEGGLIVSTRDKNVQISHIVDFDNKECNLKNLCEKHQIHIGNKLGEQKSSFKNLNVIRSSESNLCRNFLEKKSLDIPFLDSGKHNSNNSNYHQMSISLDFFKDEFVEKVVALLYVYLFKLNNYEEFTLNILNQETLGLTDEIESYVFSGIPFFYPLNPDMTIAEVKSLIKNDFANEILSLSKDIVQRNYGIHLDLHTPIILFIGEKVLDIVQKAFPVIISLNPQTLSMTLFWSSHRFQSEKENVPFRLLLQRFLEFSKNAFAKEMKISQICLLMNEESDLMVKKWNQTEMEYPKDKPFMDVFKNNVGKYFDCIAMENSEHHVTYGELWEISKKIGANLLKLEVGQQDVIAVFMTRDMNYWMVLLGIWQINAIYLPIDTGLPQARVETILLDSKAKVVITDEKFSKKALEDCGKLANVINVECLFEETETFPETYPACGNHVAFIIYTSGSTGNPKGAVIEHQGMLNHSYAKIRDLCVSKNNKIAQTATQSFDISIWQFITPLFVGGTVSVFVGQDACEPEFLVNSVERHSPQILQLVPSHMMVILDELENGREQAFQCVKWLFLTGEGLNQHICKRWFKIYPNVNIMNGYGATEVSDDATHFILTKENYHTHPDIMPVSGTVMNSQLYVLDKFMDPLPIGCKGEIYIGGDGVGRGYLNDPAKTAASFLPDPFLPSPSRRFYRTGDMGVFQHDGVLDYLGRKDSQVKLRGHRIEIGEIEGALLTLKEVAQAVAIIREDLVGQKRLIAYLILYNHHTYDEEKFSEFVKFLKNELSHMLPEYMIPNDVVFLQQFPLLFNGKLDKKNFPKPSHEHIRTNQYCHPETILENYLVDLWSTTLNLPKIGIQDHFFKIGGHSLQGMKIMAQIRKEFGIDMPSTFLFQYPTIKELSLQIESYSKMD
ncbi:amino acid adenylation domain-containing protein [Parachlamydia acanthamoebae]|uniref:amino acid adenylation domain-containing protein n=1 Tax=Parachlamydia acanthamoebae TaxID=83552 RepID=UPI000AB78A12|nr:amino acid adenylation domain-containing protein [Parachlamydia acanthamoebae]